MASESNKNILFISRWYPSGSDRMFGLFVRNHALALASFGYNVTVAFVTSTSLPQKEIFRKEISREKNLTEVIVYYKKLRFLTPLIHFYGWLLAINQAIKISGKPSLIHAHILTRVGLLAYFYALIYRIPYIVTEHWSRYYPENFDYKGDLRKKITRFVLRHAAAITVVSKRLRDAMIVNGLDFKYSIIGNSVDTETFKIGEAKNQRFRFISVTCFEDRSKNLKLLICAAEELKKQGYDFDLVLVGDGEDRKMIERYAEKRLDVIYTGSLLPQGVADEIKASHCLVLSSNYETFGIVVFEAMASGIPVITTDVADLAEIITDEYGIVIPVGDIEALKQAMKKMYNGYNTYDPLKLRSKVTETYDLLPIGTAIAELYAEVLRKYQERK